jgi:hypothetical protein
MKAALKVLALTLLLVFTAQAEEKIEQISVFQDGWGNTGSFWEVTLGESQYVVLKVQERGKDKEADIVFDLELLKEFEDDLIALKKSYNSLQDDGFSVKDKIASGDAVLHTLYGRLNGQKFKAIQVTQSKNGQERQHNLALNTTSYNGLKLGIKKARRAMEFH